MIHSLAGGEIKAQESYNFALVEVDGTIKGEKLKLWYLFEGLLLEFGDKVLVPYLNGEKCGTILRIERGLVKGRTPIPVNRCKKVIKKLY